MTPGVKRGEMGTAGSDTGAGVGSRVLGIHIPRNLAAALACLAGLMAVLHYGGVALLMDRWSSDSNYGHGYLIPFISLYFLWAKKEELKGLAPQSCLWGLGLFLLGLPARFLAMPLLSPVLSGISLVLMVNGLLLYLGGWRIYKVLWLPAVYLLFMVPLPQNVHERIANPLQYFASWASAGILDGVLGIPTIREGNVIKLAGHSLQVAEACSGMRSIMGLLALGVAFAYFWERPLWERLFLVASAVPIAILGNICRVTGTGLIYSWGREEFAQGFYHEFTGWLIYVFAMALLLLEASLMTRLFVYDAVAGKETSGEAAREESKGGGGDGRSRDVKLHKHFYVAIVILAASAAFGQVYFRMLGTSRDEIVPLQKPLSSIGAGEKKRIGEWEGMDLVETPEIQLKVGALDSVHRVYYRGDEALQLYIAYFGGVRGRAPHSPQACMPGAGWKNISNEVVDLRVSGFGEEPLRVHEDLWEKDFSKRVIVWWEYIHGRNVASRTMQHLEWALPKFMGGKVGSVLQVQVSLEFKGSMEESMKRVNAFVDALGPYIQEVLPREEAREQRVESRE